MGGWIDWFNFSDRVFCCGDCFRGTDVPGIKNKTKPNEGIFLALDSF